jgi:hypothetical protein
MSSKLTRRQGLSGSGPVTYRVLGPPGAPSAVQLNVDYSIAPEPDNFYYCDYYEVVDLEPEVLFVFGKLDSPGGNKMRNRIEVYFPAQEFVNQFWKSTEQFYDKLRDFAAAKGYLPQAPGQIAEVPQKVQVFRSNNAFMAQAGTDTVIDFSYISPRDVFLKVMKGQSLTIEALVRVSMPVGFLWGVLDACRPIAERLAPKYLVLGEGDEVKES